MCISLVSCRLLTHRSVPDPHQSRQGQIPNSHESQVDLLLAAYPTAAGSHRLRYIPGSYKAWNPNDELEDMTPQELAVHQPAGQAYLCFLSLLLWAWIWH